MSFEISCGPCDGTGYYGYDRKDTCKICRGIGRIKLEGNKSEYKECGPCGGTGYYGYHRKDTCTVCEGKRMVKPTILSEIPNKNAASTEGESKSTVKLVKMNGPQSNRIFIVHGHSNEMKEALARVLEKLGLEPIILHEKPNQGRTIIEKFTDYSDVGFAVVLLSPDDMGYPKSNSPKEAKPRARQNVIFELGFFIGKLGRNRVLPLYRKLEDFELPSDYDGVVYIPYDSLGAWKTDLVKELKASGYDIDANKLI